MVSRLRRWAASLLLGVAPRLSLFIVYGFCEIRGCWKQATNVLIDIDELEPEREWRRWKAHGPNHYFCPKHTRPNLTYLLDGTTVVVDSVWPTGGRDG